MNIISRHSGLAKGRTAVAAVTGLVCLFAIGANTARAWEIDFENLGSGVTVDSQYGTAGAITGANFGGTALFSGLDAVGGATTVETLNTATEPNNSNLSGPFAQYNDDTTLLDPGHVLILAGQGAGSIVIDFNKAMAISAMAFFDIDPKEIKTLDGTNEIEFFDVHGNQILDNAFHTPETGNKRHRWEHFNGPIYDVKRVVINLAGDGAIDKIQGWEIPEPGHAGLLAFGLAAMFWLRRRRTVAAA